MNRAAIFAAVRAAARPHLFDDPGNVLALDNLLDAFDVPREDAPRRTSDKGIALIQRFEGCAKLRPDGMIEAYPDPGSGGEPWTIGWGTTRIGGKPIARGLAITSDRADELFRDDLVKYEREVAEAIGGSPTTQSQFDALVSFHYNTGAISRATLTNKHKAGDHAGAADEFARWNKAAGKVMKGLVRRRAAEADLYRSAS